MDNFLQDHVQNVDDEASQAMADCLCNPVVIGKVLEHFSHPELLKLSFVNKLWNCEARSVMKRRGNVIAALKCDENWMCGRELEAFAVLLLKIPVVPFSSLRVGIYAFDVVCQTAAFDRIHAVILDRLQLKSFSLEVGREWSRYNGCPAFQLAKKALHRSSGVLEELELSLGGEQEEFIEEVLQNCCFPRLKILKLWQPEASNERFLKGLISRAPNLQELHAEKAINLMLNVPEQEGSSVVPVCTSRVCAPFVEIPENAASKLRLETMELLYTGPNFDFERYDRVTPRLLQASGPTTLRKVNIDAVLAATLMRYGISLPSVHDLFMDISYRGLERVEPRILRLVKDFDFTRIFPNVNKVTTSSSDVHYALPDHIVAVMDELVTVLEEPLADRACRIKDLVLWRYLRNHSIQFLGDMFPSVERLEAREYAEEQLPFGSIWNYLTHLKELDFHANALNHANLDSVFCGILPEEVAELREKDDEFLKRVNIVPVAPSITCLRNLRTLRMNYYGVAYGPITDDRTFIFSKVTGMIAFARCPNLAVTLETDVSHVYQAMGHMKPYASVVYDYYKFRLGY